MLHDWNIQARSSCCQVTGKLFEEGEFFYTLLYQNPDKSYSRQDLSEKAWQEQGESTRVEGRALKPFSFWRSLYELPIKEEEAMPANDAESLLRHLLERNETTESKTIYILALLLERKKILKPLRSEKKELLLYEHAKSGELFFIPDPQLHLEDLEQTQFEVMNLLGPELFDTSPSSTVNQKSPQNSDASS